jgi:Uma2 family endonuclease
MIAAVPIRRFTHEEFYRMGEAGILQPDEQVELLDGEIVPMQPSGPFHGASVNRLSRDFVQMDRDRWVTSPRNPLLLGKYSVPRPDIALLHWRDDMYCNSLPTPAEVYLIVEVSDSTLLMDRRTKIPLYATAGIPEVWIINVPQKVVEVYREPSSGRYAVEEKVNPGQPLAPLAFPDAVIDTAALLRA